jgi:hypothetical protein
MRSASWTTITASWALFFTASWALLFYRIMGPHLLLYISGPLLLHHESSSTASWAKGHLDAHTVTLHGLC